MDLIRIGPFEVYPSERLIRASGEALDVGARAFDLLLVLAENPGCLVTKATLIERVWPRIVTLTCASRPCEPGSTGPEVSTTSG